MSFIKYQHLERYETSEVEGINLGECYIFPKIDGTNGSVWFDREVKCASRRRELTKEADNAGFRKYILEQDNIKCFLVKYPDIRLYGEWLVPHSLKTYREDAWRKFYVFDVCKVVDEELVYLTYNEYSILLDEFEIDYIPPIKILVNAEYDDFVNQMKQNTFLIEDGKGEGEGIAIKNYSFKNKYGRITWAKIVTSEFKEKHVKEMGASKTEHKMIEQEIIDKFLTEAFIDKELEKIKLEKDGWSSKFIPELFGRLWHEFITEESWNIIKKMKNPTIHFKTLNSLMIMKVKEYRKELF